MTFHFDEIVDSEEKVRAIIGNASDLEKWSDKSEQRDKWKLSLY